MQQTLKIQLALQNWLLCKGEFFHICCSTHILNLIVKEGLKVASDALQKIRENIKHVKGSESTLDISITTILLQWWKNSGHKFPKLPVMARDLLSIPITTFASDYF